MQFDWYNNKFLCYDLILIRMNTHPIDYNCMNVWYFTFYKTCNFRENITQKMYLY